ncbi:hypothetical protein XO10_06730 [Marinitoga sp. 1135]|uniref:Regulatory protein RecX n=1 Tax=Marinitoga piezophila (strain DSM 14283 / JCM 11233 / KA3) TaxID=443254 RepID=H2J3E8_MARPK|nr:MULTISPECIES: RecX family transcriptional regulator [Marinitoga]AEX85764.1 hypothetical protein Marpi_1364 [Marinitoga piezophila KA3]APT76208.1 hypothetical protein LN42_07290 [Marinitoga sp. 1137]NUU95966.1 hypothetical protein [Marinitoga sp. 1135]NUU97878.1 hypothetical protein [Marinitoga sp. 1138]
MKKKKIDPTDIMQAEKKAISLLKYRARSEYELRKRLLETGFYKETVDEVIEKLKRFDMINDELFAYYYLYDKITFNYKGPFLLKMELISKYHIEEEIIYKALQKVLEEINLKEIIREIVKKQKRLGKDSRKIKEYLYKRGFEIYQIEEVLAEDGGE